MHQLTLLPIVFHLKTVKTDTHFSFQPTIYSILYLSTVNIIHEIKEYARKMSNGIYFDVIKIC